MALQLFKIASTEVATPQTSIDFTSIPQGYTDLLVKISIRSTDANINDGANFYFNSDTTGANYSFKRIYGNGATTTSDTSSASYRWFFVNGNTATTNTMGNAELYIPNYTGSSYKSGYVDFVIENNATTGYDGLVAGIWLSTSAITALSIASGGNYFMAGSTATLYGVL